MRAPDTPAPVSSTTRPEMATWARNAAHDDTNARIVAMVEGHAMTYRAYRFSIHRGVVGRTPSSARVPLDPLSR